MNKNIYSVLLLSVLMISVDVAKGRHDAPIAVDSSVTDIKKSAAATPAGAALRLFSVSDWDGTTLVSLSDVYPLDNESDAKAIFAAESENGFTEKKYQLDAAYRKRFLAKTGILETDRVIFYNYQKNRSVSFAVKDLPVVAQLNPYADGAESKAFWQQEYMVGFEIEKTALARFTDNHWDMLVYVGREYPFANGPLVPLRWQKIAGRKYPATNVQQDARVFFPESGYGNWLRGDAYFATVGDFRYFVQDYHHENQLVARRLIVIKTATKETVLDKVFYEGESTSLTPLNDKDWARQWTGKLFKDKAPVVFGFDSVIFGCSSISVLDQSAESIIINCDNRH